LLSFNSLTDFDEVIFEKEGGRVQVLFDQDSKAQSAALIQ
jgi:hypothetical protein